jgi:predicted permease
MENFFVTTTCLLIGIIIRRIPKFPAETGNVLNLFVIYISLPALILLKIPDLPFDKNILFPAIMPWGMLLFSAALILILSKLLKWNKNTTGCLLLLIPLGNTSFLGVPMVEAFFGPKAVSYAVLYDQLGSFIALATYGSIIIAIYGKGESKPTLKSVFIKIFTFPPFIALICAFLLRAISYPAIALNILKLLSSTLIPVVMIAVGFQLTLSLNKEKISQLTIGLLIKLIIAPLTALLFCTLLGFDGVVVNVSIFESAMPPMVSAGALAILAGLSPKLTAALVGVGILLSFATLPLIFQFL